MYRHARATGTIFAALLATTVATPASAQSPPSTAFTYQGRLESSGAPFDGIVDLGFLLYNTPEAGIPIAQPVLYDDVAVEGGLFTVDLDFGAATLDGAMYLEVLVAPDGEQGETLVPRQRIRPAPAAVQALGARADGSGRVVFSSAAGPDVLTAEQPAAANFDSLTAAWQSFTPAASGPLREIRITSIAGSATGSPTWRLFRGEGNDGAPIVGGTAMPGPIGEIGELTIAASGVTLDAGQVYTIEVSNTTLQFGNSDNAYSGGRSSIGPDNDLAFVVTVGADGPALAEVDGGDFAGESLSLTGSITSGLVDIDVGGDSVGLRMRGGTPTIELRPQITDTSRIRTELSTGDSWTIAASDGLWQLLDNNTTALRLSGTSDSLGIFNLPIAPLHVTDSGTLTRTRSDALDNDTILGEADRAMLGLYSSTTETAGSGITLARLNDTNLVDKWTINRVHGGQNNLTFRYGTNADAQSNTPLFSIDDNGNAALAGQLVQSSSGALKQDVRGIADAIDTLLALRGVRYEWKPDGRTDIGFIAEEMAKVLPEIVGFDDDGNPTGIDYGRVTALIVEAVKAQQRTIESQDRLLADLLRRVEQLEAD